MTLNLDRVDSVESLVAASGPMPPPIPTARSSAELDRDPLPEKRFPNRGDLDRAAPGRIVVLGRADGHAVVASSAALAKGRRDQGHRRPGRPRS